jgi:hypothetical protein
MTRTVAAIAALVGCALAAASATFPVGDTDLFWHLATGRETIANGIVRADAFSWTARGAPLATDQWLGQLVLYGAYSAWSWPGVIGARAVAVAVLVGCVAAAALVRRPAAPVTSVAIALPAILLSRSIWVERPELFGAALFAVLILLLQLPGRVPLVLSAPLLVLWANVHGSFALGAVLVLLVGAHGLLAGRTPRPAYAIAVAGALLSFVLTPAAAGTLGAPGIHLTDPPREIQEWALPDPTTPSGAVWAALLALVVLAASLSHRAGARDVLVIVPVAVLSLLAIRHAPLAAVAATPYLAEHLPPALRAIGSRLGIAASAVERRAPPGRPAVDLGLAAAGLALLAASLAAAPREVDESAFPVAALRELEAGPGLFAHYDWGGWLIWRAPATPVFIDGRLGPYRGAVLEDYTRVVEARPGWREILERRRVRTLLMRPADPVAVRAQQLGWRVLASSRTFVLIAVPNR